MTTNRIDEINKITSGIVLKENNLTGYREAITALDELQKRCNETEKSVIERMILKLMEFLKIRIDKINERGKEKKGMRVQIGGVIQNLLLSDVKRTPGGLFLYTCDEKYQCNGFIQIFPNELEYVEEKSTEIKSLPVLKE